MNVFIEAMLGDIQRAVEFVELYKENKNLLHLISAGEYSGKALHHLFLAKECESMSSEEYREWEDIYWEFSGDLRIFTLN